MTPAQETEAERLLAQETQPRSSEAFVRSASDAAPPAAFSSMPLESLRSALMRMGIDAMGGILAIMKEKAARAAYVPALGFSRLLLTLLASL